MTSRIHKLHIIIKNAHVIYLPRGIRHMIFRSTSLLLLLRYVSASGYTGLLINNNKIKDAHLYHERCYCFARETFQGDYKILPGETQG